MLRFIADFAKLLGADLHGLLIEDKRLASAAGLPFTRVFQRLQDEWQMLETDDLKRCLEIRAAMMQQEIAAIAEAAGIAAQLNITDSGSMEGIMEDAQASDIVVVTEPKTPADCAIHPIEDLAGAALRSPAAVLLVPAPIARLRGSILVNARGPEDPAIRFASVIAAAAKEPLDILGHQESGRPHPPPAFGRLWGRTNERLIVMSRMEHGDTEPLNIALKRRVPLLVLEAIQAKKLNLRVSPDVWTTAS